ncbi:MAG: hypothetical protein K2L38_09720 [Dysosmobacter sp.]|nr:hypothetical protein [Dysosmobacter sp.]
MSIELVSSANVGTEREKHIAILQNTAIIFFKETPPFLEREGHVMLFLAQIASTLLVFLITTALPIAVIVFIIYKLAKKLSRDHVEYQYKYQQYKEAEAELDEIAADLRRHQGEEDR